MDLPTIPTTQSTDNIKIISEPSKRIYLKYAYPTVASVLFVLLVLLMTTMLNVQFFFVLVFVSVVVLLSAELFGVVVELFVVFVVFVVLFVVSVLLSVEGSFNCFIAQAFTSAIESIGLISVHTGKGLSELTQH